ncbi:hypothetical protein [Roseateles violae]|uniref:Uncharacterized protein n=1 Tax=Roseateles violae TaxID=3058042 RepID=A0ABT8DPU7_9BURK|nr:hypothetical protein [Pelomonas sp. PFR6]MDN3919065.1 hypothetical protein [Pelomonas sp. PFR6]
MRKERRLKALVSGLLLYTAAVGMAVRLAELQLLQPLYAGFGGPRSELSILCEASWIALLMFVLALGWTYWTVRPSSTGRRPQTAWCLGGIAIAWLVGVVYGVLQVASGPGVTDMPVLAWLLSPEMPPLWGLLNTLALIAGVLLAGRRRATTLAASAPTPRMARG